MMTQEKLDKLYEIQERKSAYDHALSLLSYDGVTGAPRGTAENRAHAIGILSGEEYRISTCQETADLLEDLESIGDQLCEKDRRCVEVMLHSIRNMKKIPKKEYIAWQELLVKADDIWHTAKEKSDFSLFEPCLEQIFDTLRHQAKLFDPEKDPYDYWLNEYEEGLNMEKCDAFFSALRSRLVPLIRTISEKPQPDCSCLHGSFSDEAQMRFSQKLMELMGLDTAHVGISTTEHPFTTSFGSQQDVRITTHFLEDDFSSSMYSVIHEGGHALYDTGSDRELCYTCLDGGACMSIHESQSRFYENLIGRSRAFITLVTPLIHEYFPDTRAYGSEDFYRAVNLVQPSLIRTEADEVTYCLHIMVRYELEKALMHGELKVKDLPAEWNRLYREYLGVDVPDDRRGVLQDSHWSGGMVGYFPCYALGSAYGAQFLKRMKESLDIDKCVLSGDFKPVNEWNRDQIWRFGGLKKADRILKDVMKEAFDPNCYLDYLEAKCRDIYNI